MKVTLYTPQKKLFEKSEARSVYLPGAAGDMQILDGHIPVITSLREGVIIIENASHEKTEIEVTTGYAEFSNNNMTILIEKTALTDNELETLQKLAESQKDKVMRKETQISEEEFEHMEENKDKI